jgi:prepilin-type N-terminal cleavage/methylation domain-containing protein
MSPVRITGRSAFTLIELMVVLVILAALSTVALRSVDKLQDQAKLQATTKILEDIESALLGSRDGLPGQASAGGLVADTSRFLIESTGPPTMRFADLLQPGNLATIHFAVDPLGPAGDTEISLATGWRGPYIRRHTGATPSTTIEDGWGNAISATFNDPTWSLVSAGPDGDFGHDADNISIAFPAIPTVATVSGIVRIEMPTGVSSVDYLLQVFAFEPNADTGNAVAIGSSPTVTGMSAAETVNSMDFPLSATFFFVGDQSLTTGPRIFRAYLVLKAGSQDPPLASDLRGSTTEHHRSQVLTVKLLHGAQNLDLTIDR